MTPRPGIWFLVTALLGAASVTHAAAVTTSADPWIAAAGDIACDPNASNFLGTNPATCQHRATAAMLAGASAVLPLGDTQYETATLEKLRASYGAPDSWGAYNSVARPAVGNHEYQDPGASGYFDYFTENGVFAGDRDQGYYSYDIGSWHFIALNSNCSHLTGGCGGTSPQVSWLRSDLVADGHTCELAYWHHPRFSSRTTAKIMGAAWQALYSAGADVVLNGHQHNYERFAPQTDSGLLDTARGIRQFIVGTGGRYLAGYSNTYVTSEFRDNSTFGVLKLTLHDTSYDWQFVSTTGAVRDSGSWACH